MRLALRNLLINATLYAPPGSPVLLRLLDSEDPLGLAIEVADQGPGLPPAVHQSLLEAQATRSAGTPSNCRGSGTRDRRSSLAAQHCRASACLHACRSGSDSAGSASMARSSSWRPS